MGRAQKAAGNTAPRNARAGDGKPDSRGKGRQSTRPQPRADGSRKAAGSRKADKKPEKQLHEVYAVEGSDGDDHDALVRRRDLEEVGVRDYEVSDIDSEDDEEIESDDAFDESDEERFAVQFDDGEDGDSGPSDNELEDSDDEDGANMVDLSEMLDAGSSDDEATAGPGSATARGADGDMGVSGLSLAGDQESSDEDDEIFAGFDSESGPDDSDGEAGDDAARLSKLDGFVTSISARAPKRRFVAEAGGEFAEDENAIGSGMHARGVTLGLDDLLGSIGGAVSAEGVGGEETSARELRLLKDQVRTMEKAAKRAGSGVVAVPVPKRMQDQTDRKVAYSQTKTSVSEWQPAVDANRKAEHLSFPMNNSGKANVTTSTLIGDTTAANDMESQVQAILAQSGMSDEQQRQYEELELKQLSPEEIRNRTRELRLVRELMFRSERKAKRLAKIKSKTYRRILKRQRVHAQEKELERMKEDDPEMYEMIMEKMAQDRAEERMSLRHKNTGKWAKVMARRAHGDVDAQKAVREQLGQHDALKRKIYDIGSDEEVSDYEAGKALHGDEADSDSDPDESFASTRGRALDKLSAEIADADDEIPDGTPHKNLFEMKFMKNAMQRKREQATRDAQAVHDEIASLEAQIDEDGRAVSVKRPAGAKAAAEAAMATPGAPGRMSFGGGLTKRETGDRSTAGGDAQPAAPSDDETGSAAKRVRLNEAGQVGQVSSGGGHRVRLEGPLSVKAGPEPPSRSGGAKAADKAAKKPVRKLASTEDADGAQNPWLDNSADAGASRRGGNAGGVTKESAKVDKLTARLREKRHGAGGAAARAEDGVLLDLSKTLAVDKPAAQDDSDGEPGSDSEGIQLEHVGGSGSKGAKGEKLNPNAFMQRKLVEQAFAEDSMVEAEFAAEKDAAMELDAPKDEDLTLPGWGGWGGSGIQPKKNKIVRKAPKGSGIEKTKRLDAKLGSVIINQRQPKAANKYYANNVPFPFFTAKQYEATMQVPMGKEWNTTKAHASFVKPRIMTKAGHIIDPLSIPSKKIQ
ncbi:hypothetical protein LPJ61_001304 [Coemansia biformis]|uniref:Small-subunit processome n=1 Tax=Coemansia biformis TaxID=1286918 RepID=A0A9W8D076_9FUNG|nr:hypothetical protein LPJ61_001304 [Coemansia biformis]